MLFTKRYLMADEIIQKEIEAELAVEKDEDKRAVLMLQLLCNHDFKPVATGQVCIDECKHCGRTFTY